MNAQTILIADYLDILFSGRNKAYGGYELRKHYSRRAHRAMASMFVVVLLLLLCLNWGKEQTDTTKPIQVIVDVSAIQPPVLPVRSKPLPAAVASATTPLKKITPPKIVREEIPETTILPEHTAMATGSSRNVSGSDTEGLDDADINHENGTLPATVPPAKAVKWVEQMPEFDGQLTAYLSKHIKYPALAKENNIEGKVIIEFIVDEEGHISDTRVVKGIGGGCDEEAIRVIRSMPRWKPGRQNGKPVKVYFVLPIVFELH